MKNCKECGSTFKPSTKLRSFCKEECKKEYGRKRNNRVGLERHHEKMKNRPFAKCAECEIELETKSTRVLYCEQCGKERIKKRNREISKNRVRKSLPKYQESKKEKRKERRGKGLCTECGEKSEGALCNSCRASHNERCTKHNRKIGIQEAGGSRHENIVKKELLHLLEEEKIRERVWDVVRNPITNQSLQLDFYMPELRLAIEVDGPMHRLPIYGTKRLERQQENDRIKTEECIAKNIQLIRISTDDIDTNNENWLRITLSEAVRMALK